MSRKFGDCNEIGDLERNIMFYINDWVHKIKTPVPHTKIISSLENRETKNYMVVFALQNLIRKGYIRRSVTMSTKTFYVQLRTM